MSVRKPRIIFRTGYFGSPIAIAAGATNIKRIRSQDHVEDSLQFQVPWDAEYLAQVGLRTPVQLTDVLGRQWDYRVAEIDDGVADGETMVTITCEPPILDLTSCGPMTSFDTADVGGASGYPSLHVGGLGLTPTQHLVTFIVPWLHSRGLDWINLGDVEFDSRIDRTGEQWTPMQYLQALVEQTHGEMDFRRTEDGFAIDLVVERNASMPQVLVRLTRNIIRLSRSRRVDPFYNVLIGTGKVSTGSPDAATIAFAAWKVTAKAGDVLTLADPVGGPGPIRFADQVTNLWALTPEATLVEVTDCDHLLQQITVADASDIAVGDHVEFRADADGTQLVELTSPAAVAEFHGRVVGTIDASEMRGERSHTPNGAYTDWDVTGGGLYAGTFSGAHSATSTLDLSGFTPGTVISAGDRVHSNANTLFSSGWLIASGGTVAGDGTVTITVSGTTVTASDGAAVYVLQQHSMPTGWSAVPDASQFLRNRIDPSQQGTLTGSVNGLAAGAFRVTADGLTPGAVIQAGDVLEVGAVPTRHLIAAPVTVDGGGSATITVVDGTVAAADDAAVAITRPTFIDYGASAIWMPVRSFQGAYIQTPAYKVWANDNTPFVWCTARISIRAHAAAVIGASETIKPIKMDIINADTLAVVDSITDADRSVRAGETATFNLRKAIQITEPTRIALRVYTLHGVTTSTVAPWAYLHGCMVHVGFDPDAPLTSDSHANKIWHFVQDALEESSREPIEISGTIGDLSRLNPDLAYEALDVGQRARVIASGMAGNTTLDRVVRITRIEFDEERPENTQVTWASVSPRITRMIARSRNNAKQYVQINVGDDPTTGGTEVDVRTAPTTSGGGVAGYTPPNLDAPGATIPPSRQGDDDGTSAVPIKRHRWTGKTPV